MSLLTDASSRVSVLPLKDQASAVLGLRWQPVLSAMTPATQQALLKKSVGSHWIIQESAGHCQFGLVELTEPPLPPAYSLSLQLIGQLGPDWIAIIQLPDHQYGFLGVADGRVVPGCELVLGTASEAVEQFHCYQTLFQWQVVYAPATLNLGGQPLPLDDLLATATPQIEHQLRQIILKKIRISQRLRRYASISSLLLLAVGSAWFFYQRRQRAIRLVQHRYQQLQQLQADAKKAIPPWQQQPPALEVIDCCMQAINQHPLFLGGWRLADAYCSTNTLSLTYQRPNLANVKVFLAAAERQGISYQLEGHTKARLNYPITLPKGRPAETLIPTIDLVCELMQQFEQGIATGQIDDVLSSAKTHANFQMNSDISPRMLLQQLPLAGVVIHSLHATVQEGGAVAWKCTGTLYGK